MPRGLTARSVGQTATLLAALLFLICATLGTDGPAQAQDDAPAIQPLSQAQDDTPAIQPLSQAQDDAPAIQPLTQAQDDAPAIQPLPQGDAAPSQSLQPLGQSQEAQRPGLWQRTLFAVRQMQQDLQRQLGKAVRAIKTSPTPGPMLLLVGLSFLYGIFHAIGPGHGKIVITSYLVGYESQVRRGVWLAFLASFVQGLSAIALVAALAIVLDLSRLETTASTRHLEIASYGLIVAIGLWMLVAALRGKSCEHGHGHHHGATPAAPDDDGPSRSAIGRMAAVVAAVGIRPCSGAVIVLLFSLAQGLFLLGIGATFAMALGTAITVSALAILAVSSRKLAVRLAGGDGVWERRLQMGLGVLGSLAILGFGALLLSASLTQPRTL